MAILIYLWAYQMCAKDTFLEEMFTLQVYLHNSNISTRVYKEHICLRRNPHSSLK